MLNNVSLIRRSFLISSRSFSRVSTSDVSVKAEQGTAKSLVSESSSTLLTKAHGSVPVASSLSISKLSDRRNAIEAHIIPRNLEEPTISYIHGAFYTAFALTVGTLAFFIYRASKYDSESEAQALHVITAKLRTCRKEAKDALLRTATESGEIPLGMDNEGGLIKWWSSGPRNSETSILLAASDGENAAIWGLVHARLAELVKDKSVRIVSFHRAGARSQNVPLSLRMRDMELVQNDSRFGKFPSKTIIVQQGEGTWAGLAYSALNSDSVRGLVCVAPLLNHRGRQMAWIDAVLGASRVAHADDPGLLRRLLDPPPVYVSNELAKALDESSQKRGLMVDFFNNQLGVVNRGNNPEEKADRDSKRFDEDFRRRKSTQSVLNESETNLVRTCCESLQEKKNKPAVKVLTYSPNVLPSFLPPESLMVFEAAFLASAHAVGSFLVKPGENKISLERNRAANRRKIISEMSGGLLNLQTGEDEPVSSSSYDIARIKHAFGSVFQSLSLAAMSSTAERSNAIVQSKPFRILEEERIKHLPLRPEFDITLVHYNSDRKTDDERLGVFSIPLQLEGAIVDQVIQILDKETGLEDKEKVGYSHYFSTD